MQRLTGPSGDVSCTSTVCTQLCKGLRHLRYLVGYRKKGYVDMKRFLEQHEQGVLQQMMWLPRIFRSVEDYVKKNEQLRRAEARLPR